MFPALLLRRFEKTDRQDMGGDARFQGMAARRIRFQLIVMRYSSGASRSHPGRSFTKPELVA